MLGTIFKIDITTNRIALHHILKKISWTGQKWYDTRIGIEAITFGKQLLPLHVLYYKSWNMKVKLFKIYIDSVSKYQLSLSTKCHSLEWHVSLFLQNCVLHFLILNLPKHFDDILITSIPNTTVVSEAVIYDRVCDVWFLTGTLNIAKWIRPV